MTNVPNHYAAELHCAFIRLDSRLGPIIAMLAPLSPEIDNVLATSRRVDRCTTLPSSHFAADTKAGQHLCRIIARKLVLNGLRRSQRHDAEGFASIHLETQSHKVWTKWKASLDIDERTKLRIWRGGAVGSATRRLYRPKRGYTRVDCHLCGAVDDASARHLFARCPAFNAQRVALQRTHNVPAGWWESVPRVTSKTGWVVHTPNLSTAAHASLQVAACKLGIMIINATEELVGIYAAD